MQLQEQEQGRLPRNAGCRQGPGCPVGTWAGCGEGRGAKRGRTVTTWTRTEAVSLGTRPPPPLGTHRPQAGSGWAAVTPARPRLPSRQSPAPHQVSVSGRPEGQALCPVSDSPAPSGPASSRTWPWGRVAGCWCAHGPVRHWRGEAEGSESHTGGDEPPPRMEQGRPQTRGWRREPLRASSDGCGRFSGSSTIN